MKTPECCQDSIRGAVYLDGRTWVVDCFNEDMMECYTRPAIFCPFCGARLPCVEIARKPQASKRTWARTLTCKHTRKGKRVRRPTHCTWCSKLICYWCCWRLPDDGPRFCDSCKLAGKMDAARVVLAAPPSPLADGRK